MVRTRSSWRATLTSVAVASLLAAVVIAGAPVADAAPAAGAAATAASGAVMPSTPAPSAGCGSSTVVAGDATITTSSGGDDRTYIRHVPPAHDGATPVPLVIALHGLGEGSVLHQQTSEWAPRADADGFAVVFPQALGSPAAWNLSGSGPDAAFVAQVLDELEGSLCIDTDRVFMSGFSMGAMLTSVLMCGPMSERIAAVAPVAGLLNPAGCAPERAVPAISFHGTLDTWVPMTPIPGNVAAWANRNGCGAPPTETAIPGDEVVTIDHIVYPCPDGADVEWYEITEGGHAWPGSAFSRAIAAAVGYTTFAIHATDLMWDFFEGHPLPAPTTTEGTFDALTYNVAGLPAALSGSEPDINTPYISPLLNDYDLVLVQEDWDNPDPPIPGVSVYHDILVADADHPYQSVPKPTPLGTNPLRPTALLSDGLNHLSDFPFGEVTRVMWPSCFGGADTSDGGAADCLAEKGFSVMTTELAPGVEVDVYNLHGEAGNTVTDLPIRAEDYEVLAAFMETRSAGRAVIVGGDFNLHTDREFDGQVFDELLAATGLTDVCGVVDCGTDADRIDKFIFRSGGGVVLEPLDHTFEREKFVRPTDGAPLSDHDALHVPFRWSVDPFATGTIRGRVTQGGDEPVAGATVAAYRPTDSWVGTATTVTAADGSYEISGLPAGEYQVLFVPISGTPLRTEWSDDSYSRAGAQLVAVTAAGVTPGVDADLELPAMVSGTVTDIDGEPVAGLLVWAYSSSDLWVGSAAAFTDAEGRYSIQTLDPGAYKILFAAWGTGYRQEWNGDVALRRDATALAVTAEGPAPVVDAVLAP